MMPSNNNNITSTNESFKLLELSDDLKSLSDLELPEIINQKKRKVRRKTRSRTPSSRAHSSHNTNEPNLPCHKNLGIWIAVFMLGGWLFLLSYMTTVIHTENSRLKIELEKMSASSQNIPESFQKWHETSKKLEQNQTMLQNSITEIREVLKNFSLELNQLKDNISKETKTSKESQIIELQSEIAGFGATIKDFKSNFDTITNDKLPKLQNDIQLNKESFINLTQLITKQLNATNLTSITTTSDSTNLIEELKLNLLKQIATLNGTLTANITELYEYYNQISEKVTNQHTLLEKNIDDILNMSTEITSIQNDWTQHKPTILSFEQFTKNVTQDLQDLRTNANNLNAEINLVNKDCKSMNDNITSDIQAIKENLDRTRNVNDRSAAVPPPPPTTSLVPNTNKSASSSNVSSLSAVTEVKPISTVTPTSTATVPVPSKNDDSPDFMS